jgi:hypothetical protein
VALLLLLLIRLLLISLSQGLLLDMCWLLLLLPRLLILLHNEPRPGAQVLLDKLGELDLHAGCAGCVGVKQLQGVLQPAQHQQAAQASAAPPEPTGVDRLGRWHQTFSRLTPDIRPRMSTHLP